MEDQDQVGRLFLLQAQHDELIQLPRTKVHMLDDGTTSVYEIRGNAELEWTNRIGAQLIAIDKEIEDTIQRIRDGWPPESDRELPS